MIGCCTRAQAAHDGIAVDYTGVKCPFNVREDVEHCILLRCAHLFRYIYLSSQKYTRIPARSGGTTVPNYGRLFGNSGVFYGSKDHLRDSICKLSSAGIKETILWCAGRQFSRRKYSQMRIAGNPLPIVHIETEPSATIFEH